MFLSENVKKTGNALLNELSRNAVGFTVDDVKSRILNGTEQLCRFGIIDSVAGKTEIQKFGLEQTAEPVGESCSRSGGTPPLCDGGSVDNDRGVDRKRGRRKGSALE